MPFLYRSARFPGWMDRSANHVNPQGRIRESEYNNGSNGCFSIDNLTPLDARNCLCGRGATGSVTIDGSAVTWDYSSIRANWGCDSAG